MPLVPGCPLVGNVLRIPRLKIAKSTIRIVQESQYRLYSSRKLKFSFKRTLEIVNHRYKRITVTWHADVKRVYLNYSESDDDPQHRNGVGIFVTSEIEKFVLNFVPITTEKKFDREVDTLSN